MTWTKEDAERLMAKTWETHPPSKGPTIITKASVEPFKSPVDGRVITNRAQLEKHNKENNVVDSREFTSDFYDSKARERAKLFDSAQSHDKESRVDDIKSAIRKLSKEN